MLEATNELVAPSFLRSMCYVDIKLYPIEEQTKMSLLKSILVVTSKLSSFYQPFPAFHSSILLQEYYSAILLFLTLITPQRQ